jgi:predicted transposase YbfD/YdcC
LAIGVTFKEDACIAKDGNSLENLSTLRKYALQILNKKISLVVMKRGNLGNSLD